MSLKPTKELRQHILNIDQARRSNVKQFLRTNLAIEMNQTVPVPGHITKKTSFPFTQDTDLSKLKGNIFIFHHCAAKAFGENVSTKVEQSLKTSPHIRLGSRDRPWIAQEGLLALAWQ
jgi:hypothetical protein